LLPGCGGWNSDGAGGAVGLGVGMVAGAALASANNNAAASNAYSSGYAAGSANAQYAMGAIYATLPSSWAATTANDATYYLCGANGNTWIQPCYGANGIRYRIAPSPY
jgi:hypothetical protein